MLSSIPDPNHFPFCLLSSQQPDSASIAQRGAPGHTHYTHCRGCSPRTSWHGPHQLPSQSTGISECIYQIYEELIIYIWLTYTAILAFLSKLWSVFTLLLTSPHCPRNSTVVTPLPAAALRRERGSESTATRASKERRAQQRVLNYLFSRLGPFAFPLSCFLAKFASCFCICKRHRFFK